MSGVYYCWLPGTSRDRLCAVVDSIVIAVLSINQCSGGACGVRGFFSYLFLVSAFSASRPATTVQRPSDYSQFVPRSADTASDSAPVALGRVVTGLILKELGGCLTYFGKGVPSKRVPSEPHNIPCSVLVHGWLPDGNHGRTGSGELLTYLVLCYRPDLLHQCGTGRICCRRPNELPCRKFNSYFKVARCAGTADRK